MDMFTAILLTIITASTPLLLAAMGELVVERSGVLNLGVEGMMVMGAVCGFGAAFVTGNPYLGILASIAAGVFMSLLFGLLTLTLVANQVATGLALTLLGLGLSGLIGESFRRPARRETWQYRSALMSWSYSLSSSPARRLCSVPRQSLALSSAPLATAILRPMRWVLGYRGALCLRRCLAAAVRALPAVICRLPIRRNGLRT